MMQVPHLTTALTGPIFELEQCFLDNQTMIEAWLRQQWQATPAVITSSVDLRNAGFKLAPVDTNLFPAGFNNLNSEFMPMCFQAMQMAVSNLHPHSKSILIIAESHTRNLPYFESLAVLTKIIKQAGFHVEIASLSTELTTVHTLDLPSGKQLTIKPLQRDGNLVMAQGSEPSGLILMNNDLSDKIPSILEGLEQAIEAPLSLSWSLRQKSNHFTYYQSIANDFSQLLGIDSWLMNPLFRVCGDVDFMTREGEACVIRHVDLLLDAINDKYKQYGIKHEPYVVVKSDSGTYGMGVFTVRSADAIKNMNRKQRKKMAAGKGSVKITQVMVQEGVPTVETFGSEAAAAEPVVYMLGQYVVGGFYRLHSAKGDSENLNSPGMSFEPLAFVNACNAPQADSELLNRFYAYGVIARLAALAAAHERAEIIV